MLTILIRTVILYIAVVIALRLMGKKQLGELQPSELVTTILISNIATVSIEDLSLPMLSGIIPIVLIVSLDVIMSMITLKSGLIRKTVTGSPRVIISGGNIDQKEMRELRYTIDDLLEAMRECGIFDLAEVQYAIVETTGKINFLERPAPPSAPEDPPVVIVSDGVLSTAALESAGLDKKWLRQVLFDNKIAVNNIFILTAKKNGEINLVKKAQRRKK